MPVIPSIEVPAKMGTVPPLQIARTVPKLNVGTIFGLTVTVSCADVAHCPGSGVNVYVPEF